jgi:hypothetical protein
MIAIVLIFNLVSFFCLQNPASSSLYSQGPRSTAVSLEPAARQPEDASRIWEQAIAAKGGRNRLDAVRNMAISTTGKYDSSLLKKNGVRREELVVLPNKYWFFEDYRPDVFGVTISMYNYDTMLEYSATEGDPHPIPKPIAESQTGKALRNNQLSFLLETQWLKPTLERASIAKIGLHPVDIVETTVAGERVVFAFDQKTHLPVRVTYYDIVRGKEYANVQSFSDYSEVNGLQLPQTLSYGDGSKYTATFQLNVEYNDDIFVRPPAISAGPTAWRLTTR